jgi:23S rRNA pseudouridine955/2504/2580 synthase
MHPPDSRQAAAGKAESQVRWVEVDDGSDGQRLDNFLMRLCKGVPKTHLYKAIRSGEVRVNRGRAQADTRIKTGDQVRIPPLRLPAPGRPAAVPAVEFPVLFEDGHLLVVDKPAGVAVHGGSGVAHGVIEQLRAARPEARFLELAHRLDRETSGILVLAKRRSTLVALHEDLRQGRWEKRYQALVRGDWGRARDIRRPLLRTINAAGERQVRVDEQGQYAHTRVRPLRRFEGFTLIECLLKTGRTHQIRVHVASEGHPIAGDERYGDFAWNRQLQRTGLRRMFLHAESLQLLHPATGQRVAITSPLPTACTDFLATLLALPAGQA